MSGKTRDASVADAIVAELNGATWPFAFTAARAFTAELDKADTKTMQVIVQQNGVITEQITRKHRRETQGLTISIRKNIDPKNVGAVDSLSAFAESVADFFRGARGKRKIDGTEASVTEASTIQPNPDELKTTMQFFAGVSLSIEDIYVHGVSSSGGVPGEGEGA